MGRNFPNDLTTEITLGDIASARFQQLNTYSFISFFRIEDSVGDDRGIVTKTGQSAADRQFLFRTDMQAAPSNLEVYTNLGAGGGLSLRISGGNNIALDTWYLGVVTNDGTGGAGGLILYLVDMAGTFLDDAVPGSHTADAPDLTEPIRLGVGTDGGSDPMDGDMAYSAYFTSVLTKQDINDYLYQPYRTAVRIGGVQFFLSLGVASPEPDWGGLGNNGTVTGSPTAGDNPPVGPLFGFDLGWQGGPPRDPPHGRTKGITNRRMVTALLAAQRDDADGNPTEEYLLLRTDQFGRTRVTS